MSELTGYIGSIEDVNSVADLLQYAWIILIYPMFKDKFSGLSKLIPKRRDAYAVTEVETRLKRIEALLLAGASPINLGKEYEMVQEVAPTSERAMGSRASAYIGTGD